MLKCLKNKPQNKIPGNDGRKQEFYETFIIEQLFYLVSSLKSTIAMLKLWFSKINNGKTGWKEKERSRIYRGMAINILIKCIILNLLERFSWAP